MQSPICKLIDNPFVPKGELIVMSFMLPALLSVIVYAIIILVFRFKQRIFLTMVYAVKHPTLLVELQRTESDKTNTLFTLKAPLV